MKRRQFIKNMAGAAGAAAGFSMNYPFQPLFKLARAHTPSFGQKTVVAIYLRGGNDGINTVVPHGYPAGTGYYDPGFRPTIAIPKPNGGDPTACLDIGGGLGLHPGMSGMHQMFLDGHLAIMPAVHYPSASRSHFSGQQYTESAAANLTSEGLFNRVLQDTGTLPTPGNVRAMGVGSDLPHILRGNEIVSVFNNLTSFELGITGDDEAEVLNRLTSIYNQSADPAYVYSGMLHDFGRVTINDLAIIKDLNDNPHTPDLDPDSYVSAGSVPYTTSTFNRQMSQTALLIKAGVGLEAASLSRGGFDDHSNQAPTILSGPHFNALDDVSNGLAAFFSDLDTNNADTGAPYMDDVIVVILSEFGRTSFENGSFGTDHAHATSWFVAGTQNTINGGVYLGRQNSQYGNPGGVSSGGIPNGADITDWIAYDPLNVDNMINGRYLNHTIDYQNVFGEIIDNFLIDNYGGGSPSMGYLLPQFTYSDVDKVGFLV